MQVIGIETLQKKYPIWISNQGPNWISKEIMNEYPIKKWLIITDENVADLYLEGFKNAFNHEKTCLHNYILAPGENSKSLKEAEKIYDFLSENDFTRSDGIIAFGGGVVGDLAGFVASTYLRGIPWLQVPTTLLAQVDSSVGGKVAINTKHGKNLVGSFYQPNGVFVEVSFLNTLNLRELKSGFGEVIKYACIYDRELFNSIEGSNLESIDWLEIVSRCINIKKYFVEQDEREENLRKHLNFGHTLGHGLEKYHNFVEMTHGEGVVRGLLFATWLSMDLGFLMPESYHRVHRMIEHYGYKKLNESYDLEKLYGMMLKDKKRQGDGIDYILLKDVGKSFIYQLPNKTLKDKLIEGLL